MWVINQRSELTNFCGSVKLYFIIAMITTGVTAVSKILMGNCTLQVLNVNGNSIGDDGISVIVEQLQHITTLTKLIVMKSGLSVKGTIVCVKCTISPDGEDYRIVENVGERRHW